MPNLRPLEVAKNLIDDQEKAFGALAKEYNNKAAAFKREAEYAVQLLQSSDYLLKAATAYPDSLKYAILNVASTGLSLSPALKQAYLVPRQRKKGEGAAVCLDISYIGMCDLATETGSIEWVRSKVVYKNDTYTDKGLDQMPLHESDTFSKERGDIIGAYCCVKLANGDYLTETMNIDEIHDIRSRSQAFKKGYGPWRSDYTEMIKKTVVKRAAKMWPKVSPKLDKAIDVANEVEGIDFKAEEGQGPITDEQLTEISALFKQLDKDDEKFMVHLSETFKRDISEVTELIEREARLVITQLKQWVAVTEIKKVEE